MPEANKNAAAPLWLRVRHALGRVRRAFTWEVFDVFARPVRGDDRAFAAPQGYAFGWGTPEDVAGCEEQHTELDAHERREGLIRLSFGHRVIVGKHDGLVVFTMWENPRHANVPGLIKRRLRPDQAFIYKAYTSPDHRKRGLYEAGMRFVLAELARDGKAELVGYAHVKKRISRKGLAALDFTSLGRFHVLSVPGWSRVFVTKELRDSLPQDVARTNVMQDPTALETAATERV